MAQKLNQKQTSIKYDTSEQVTGDVWVDGKPIYRKTVNTGSLPNNTTKNVAHGISGLTAVIKLNGYTTGAGGLFLPLPYVTSAAVSVYFDTTNIIIGTVSDRTAYTTSYVIMEYTK